MNEEIKSLIAQCEANITSFDNDQMSAALWWGQTMRKEIASVLQMLDELAELWGDEGKFRACRDRLRKLVAE